MTNSSTHPSKFPGLRQFQNFGEHWPVYEVLSVDEGPRVARVHVFENGDELDHTPDRTLRTRSKA